MGKGSKNNPDKGKQPAKKNKLSSNDEKKKCLKKQTKKMLLSPHLPCCVTLTVEYVRHLTIYLHLIM